MKISHVLPVMFFLISSCASSSLAASYKDAFWGTWEGSLSGQPFTVKVWSDAGKASSIIHFSGFEPEKMAVMGWKKKYPILYLFRYNDVACVTMFYEADVMTMAYFEKDSVRKIILKKVL